MMSKSKTMPLTTAVKNYLLQCIAKAESKPERILSEMQLCEKFGVSRITVRRAIKVLEQTNYLIRIAGRQGAFTNPQMAMAVPHIVGILFFDGTRNYLNDNSAEILTGFMNEMKSMDCDFEFMLLNAHSGTDICQEIENMAFDGLLWIMPDDSCIAGINLLLKKEYPIVILDSIYNSESLKPNHNTIIRDYEYHAVQHARLMLKQQYEQIVRIGVYNISARVFQSEMQKRGIVLPPDFFIGAVEEISSKLPPLLATKKVDAIICTGGLERYEKLLQILTTQESWKNIPVFMEKNRVSEKLQKKHPDLKIELTPTYYACKDLGGCAGRCMKQMMHGKYKAFESIIVPANKTQGKKK